VTRTDRLKFASFFGINLFDDDFFSDHEMKNKTSKSSCLSEKLKELSRLVLKLGHANKIPLVINEQFQ
jgi:hypothetical protein